MVKNEIAVAKLQKDIEYIKKSIDDGFQGIHKRQDLANGKLMKHEKCLIEHKMNLDDLFENKAEKSDILDHDKEELKKELSWKTKVVDKAVNAGVTALIILVFLKADAILKMFTKFM